MLINILNNITLKQWFFVYFVCMHLFILCLYICFFLSFTLCVFCMDAGVVYMVYKTLEHIFYNTVWAILYS